MGANIPYQFTGKTISLRTNAVANTSQSRQVLASDFGLTYFPTQIRLLNRGTSDIWISFSTATATLVIPTPGTTTVGTPQPCFILLPGIVEVFTISPGSAPFFVSDISTDVNQTYHLCPGEGL